MTSMTSADLTKAELAPERERGPWFRNLETVVAEHDRLRIEAIEGDWPESLRGVLYQNGPGRYEVHGRRYALPFDGDGMIRAFHLDGGRVTFSNRYVRTPWFEREERERRMIYRASSTQAPGGIAKNAFRLPKNMANTHVVLHAGRLLALYESGRPFALDPSTLETLREETFDGSLPSGLAVCAHPHRDPDTGALYDVAIASGLRPALHVWRFDTKGGAMRTTVIRMRHQSMVHDFGLTATKVVVLAPPFHLVRPRLFGWLLGTRTLFDTFAWHPGEPLRAYVRDRDGREETRTYELPPRMLFHVANAYDDGEDVVVDAVMFDDDGAIRMFADGFNGRTPSGALGRLCRARLCADGSSDLSVLSELEIEFPRIDERFETRPHRFVYAVVYTAGDFGSSKIARIDTRSGEARVHDFGSGCYAAEPVFAPRPGGGSDEGWLLSTVYDSASHRSFLAVVDTDRMGASDARARLPLHLPYNFHGQFVPA